MEIVRSRNELVLSKGEPLPRVCLKCGRRSEVTHEHREFAWAPPWIWVTLLFGFIWPFILYLVMKQSGAIELPLCADCRRRRAQATAASVAAVLSVLAGVVSLVVGVARGDAALGGAALLAIVVVPTIVQLLVVRPRTVSPSRIDAQRIWLRGVGPEALLTLEREAPREPVLGTTLVGG